MNTLPPNLFAGGVDGRHEPSAAPVPRPGRGTLLTLIQGQYLYSAAGDGRARYPHPFKPFLSPTGVSFSRGLVEVYEPKIYAAKKIAGQKISTGVQLRLDPAVANKDGESWCCIEAAPNALGQIDGDSRLEMVHTAQSLSADPEVARCPVALILWSGKAAILAHAIVYFNLRYQRVTPVNQGPPRHLFF